MLANRNPIQNLKQNLDTVSGSRLPPLRPLAGSPLVLGAGDDDEPAEAGEEGRLVELSPDGDHPAGAPAEAAEVAPLPWEARGAEAEAIESELKAFCRAGELVYAAVVDTAGAVKFSVCTVGSRPHNEAQIGDLVGQVFGIATALGGQVGERQPQGLNLQGARWSYSLDPLPERHLLFGIYPSKALPAIVRACAQKTRAALEASIDSIAEDS